IRLRCAAELLTVALEDPKLQAAGLGRPAPHRNVTATLRRPLFRDHEQLRGAVGLRRAPSDGGDLSLVEPVALVPLAKEAAEVVALGSEPRAGLAREILRAAGVRDVLIERHAVREPLCRHDALAAYHTGERSLGSPGASRMVTSCDLLTPGLFGPILARVATHVALDLERLEDTPWRETDIGSSTPTLTSGRRWTFSRAIWPRPSARRSSRWAICVA